MVSRMTSRVPLARPMAGTLSDDAGSLGEAPPTRLPGAAPGWNLGGEVLAGEAVAFDAEDAEDAEDAAAGGVAPAAGPDGAGDAAGGGAGGEAGDSQTGTMSSGSSAASSQRERPNTFFRKDIETPGSSRADRLSPLDGQHASVHNCSTGSAPPPYHGFRGEFTSAQTEPFAL